MDRKFIEDIAHMQVPALRDLWKGFLLAFRENPEANFGFTQFVETANLSIDRPSVAYFLSLYDATDTEKVKLLKLNNKLALMEMTLAGMSMALSTQEAILRAICEHLDIEIKVDIVSIGGKTHD